MLAYPDLIPKELYSAIEPYYKQMIFYGTSILTLHLNSF